MKAMLRTVDDHGEHYEALMFVCPGCALPYTVDDREWKPTGLHMLPVNSAVKSPSWDFDGNLEAPTLSPSILTHGGQQGEGPPRCHSFLRAGVFEFLDDCTHAMAGQHVPMPDLPEWVLPTDGG